MARLNWFQRITGRAVQVAVDCECRSYGRAGCFSCVRQPEPEERVPSSDTRTLFPSWWDRFCRQQLTDKDLDFLTGVTRKARRRW